MKNKDILAEQKKTFAANFQKAVDKKDVDGVMQCFEEYSNSLQSMLIETAQEYAQTNDSAILSARGIRQLTEEEKAYYDGLAKALSSANPKQALTDAALTIPTTVIDTVMEDITREHPLLNAIDFQNTSGALKWIYADGSMPLAAWGALNSEITKEITKAFHSVDFSACKLSAFIPVPKDMLKLGAQYLDSYIRAMLAEAIACGLEKGIVKGTGKNEPIGMLKDLNGSVVQGVYPDKTAVKMTSFAVDKYCEIVAKLADNGDGTYRTINEVALICNPKDYLLKICPATTVLATNGTYINGVFPFPTAVYQTEALSEGEAIIGLPKKYLACIAGSNKSGDITYSDDAQFLEDNRVYVTKLHGTGRPKDNTAFVKLDISKLEALKLRVTVEQEGGSTTTSTTGGTDSGKTGS